MLINRKQEGGGRRAVKNEVPEEEEGENSHEYQSADELYEILAKNHPFNSDDKKSLTTQDLVILYKNIDIGTKLLSNNGYDINKKKPNQHVESVVYNDEHDSDGSEVSEIYSNEDIDNVFMINSERMDLFNMQSYDNTLCQKLGNINMKSSKLSTEYDKHFLFNDPYVKEQLKSFKAISKWKHSDSSVLTTSLLDYICCKRLEDNYNFYMDNVIQYVKHTIDQLKRISNGDYLTDRVKEKWKEVCDQRNNDCKMSILKTTKSIHLHADNFNRNKSMWDGIVHSEIDVRTLSKLLEKKIVVEVPKLLSGSFKLFSKCYKNKLYIRYKKDKQTKKEKGNDSQVDVVLKLKHSDTGVISNIDSIMILKTVATPVLESDSPKRLLALQIDNIRSVVKDEKKPIKVIELADEKDISTSPHQEATEEFSNEITGKPNEVVWKHFDECCNATNIQSTKRAEANFKLNTPEELRCSMQRLTMQLPVLEEVEDISSKRKKSPTKIRIKSPYENKSFILEERKRKKLLEIREKREKKKMAINENCKIIKHRYGKGAFMPQPSNSVTKLSITNKSFYNSIYGQTLNADSKITRKGKGGAKGDGFSTLDLQTGEEDVKRSKSLLTPDRNNQKYINRSYYLDDAETEVMYMQMKRNCISEEARETSTASTSLLSNDTTDNLVLLQKFINHSSTDFSATDTTLSSSRPNVIFEQDLPTTNCKDKSHISIKSTNFTVPTNTPKVETDENNKDNIPPSLQCRQSIEKVYNLINVLSKTDTYSEIQTKKSKLDIHNMKLGVRVSSSVQNSDSGTSIKHQLTSSNPSSFSFDKPNFDKSNVEGATNKSPVGKVEQSISVVPKVIISSKNQTGKIERERNKKEIKRSLPEVPKNPLKAISQLLHEFDHVQKTRTKTGQEIKSNRRLESTSEGKTGSRQFSRKFSYTENIKNNDPLVAKSSVQYDRRARCSPGKESVKTTLNSSSVEEKCTDKSNKKKLTDFIDEVKELNGEAVRGPPKRSSRLNSLAQPKKSYVQAHHEEYQTRYGKNIVSDRLQKLASTPIQERNLGTASYKNRQRRGTDIITGANKYNTGPCLGAKSRRSANSSPEGTGKRSPVPAASSYNYTNVAETTEPMKIKMVAVETYVKSHFGHVAPEREQSEESVRKSRVPLIPTDFDIASMTSSPAPDESTALGKKLHSIIDSMVSHPPALSALMESNESSTKLEKDVEAMSIETSSKYDEIVSCSDYPVDVFEDRNIVTAVESILNNKDDEIVGDDNYEKFEMDGLNSKKELQMLENALYNQLSNGNFQKRLRNKNLTLTPKQSLQQVVILQSGDSRSMVKTTLSQKIDISKTDKLSQLAELPGLSKSCMGWDFTNFPIQIATVGYAFTKIQPVKSTSTPKFKMIVDIDKDGKNRQFTCTSKSDKSLQCSRDNQIYQLQNSNSTIKFIPKNENYKSKGKKSLQQDVKKLSDGKEPQEINDNKVEMSKVIKENDNDDVGHTSSLDILVGLLNEIKKITTCQADMVNLSNNLDVDLEKKELEIILNKAVEQETLTDPALKKIVSRTTLQNLHQLGLEPSDYSITSCRDNILKIDKQIASSDINLSYLNKHLTLDKEINVNIFEKQWVNRCTEVSKFFPVKVSHSTDVTDSLTNICIKSSNLSVDLFKDCLSLETTAVENLCLQTFYQDSRKSVSSMTCPNQFLADCVKENDVEHNECKITQIVPKNYLLKKNPKRQPKESTATITEFDPLIKIKRDILVTVYSILVFTMFAALSFPQFAY